MTRTTKSLLVLALAGLGLGIVFVAGLLDVGSNAAVYVTLPCGAVFLGLFLVSKMLEKEVALLDAQQAAPASPARAARQSASDQVATHATAH